jgi:hypothetical protein
MKFKELRSVLPTCCSDHTYSIYSILHLYAGLDLPREVVKPSLCELVKELGYDPDGDSYAADYDTDDVNPYHVERLIKSRLEQTHGEARHDDILAKVRELEDHIMSRFDGLEVERVHASYDGTFSWLHVQLAVPKPKITVH